MTLERPSGAVEPRDQGLALADALLESDRPLEHLPEVAHTRVKRRLKASLRRVAIRRQRWLQPAVIGGLMLLCGAAFGIAFDRLVLRRPAAVPVDKGAAGSASSSPSRRGGLKVSATSKHGSDEPARAESPPAAEPATSAQMPAAEPQIAVPAAKPPMRAPATARRLAMRLEAASVVRLQPPTAIPATDPVPALAAARVESAAIANVVAVEIASPAPAKVSPAAVDNLSEERLLAAAVRSLRAQSDPQAALVALNEYRTRFPRGRLLVEADVLRVGALLALHREGEALDTLDHLDFSRMPGGIERQLQRGELRASVGRWQDAQNDFSHVLLRARNQDRDVTERALWGRAQSHARLGNKASASIDAKEYLRRFPNGRFAAQAKRLIDSDDLGPPQ